MKNIFLSALALLCSKAVTAQKLTLAELNLQREHTNKTGLMVLGGWSAANIVYGSLATSRADGSAKYFHQMNVYWNIVNLTVASAGYLTAKKEAGLDYTVSLKKQHSVEKIFLLNAGLDVAYIAGGLYLQEKSKTSLNNHNRYKGYGQSIMLQGSALLLFDGIMYAINNRHGKRLYNLNDKVHLSASGNEVGVVVKL